MAQAAGAARRRRGAAALGRRRRAAGRRGPGRGAAGGAPCGPGDPHVRRARAPSARPSLPRGGAPARARGGRAVGRGRPRAGDRQRPRRDDDPGLGDARAAASRGRERRSRRREQELRTGPRARGGRRGGHAAAGGGRGRSEPASRTWPAASRALGATALANIERSDPEAAEFLAALDEALPRDTIVVCDMCIPGYWLGGFRTPAAPRKLSYPLGWGTLGCAVPQGLGAALAGPRAGGERVGRRRLPLRLRRTGHRRAGAHPAHRADRGRRRLRDAALRPGPARRPARGRGPATPDFVALAGSFGVRAEAVDGLGGGARRRRSRVTSSATSPACWWRGPPWARLRTPRRAGTGRRPSPYGRGPHRSGEVPAAGSDIPSNAVASGSSGSASRKASSGWRPTGTGCFPPAPGRSTPTRGTVLVPGVRRGADMRVCLAWEGDRLAAALPLMERRRRWLVGDGERPLPVYRPVGSSPEAVRAVVEAGMARRAASFAAGPPLRRSRAHDADRGRRGRRAAATCLTAEHVSPIVETAGASRPGGRPRSPAGARRSSASAARWRATTRPSSRSSSPRRTWRPSWPRVRGRGQRLEGTERHGHPLGPPDPVFYREVAASFAERGELRLSRIVLDGHWAAFDLCLLYRDRLYLLKTGYDERFRRLAPGLVMRLSTIERCFELGLRGPRAAGRRHGVEAQVRDRRAPPRGLPRLRARPGGQLELRLPRPARPLLKRAYEGALARLGSEPRRAGSPGSPDSSATSICAFWSLPA